MDGTTSAPRDDRHPAETYQDILDRDTHPVPWALRQESVPEDLGVESFSVDRYFSKAFFELEVEHVWLKSWQMACREEEIPNVGDYHIYENVGKSLLVVRTAPDEIKAFYNSCLHRGRKLATSNGCKKEFRCPFQGFVWNVDGSFKENPIGWDFPQWSDRDMSLPQAKVGTWGGFVFINFDPDCPTLESVLGPLPKHFERWKLEQTYKAVHVARVIRCNWKVAAEAFMESHHTVATHPQLLPFLADANSQYDIFSDYITRQITAAGVASPFVEEKGYTEADILKHMVTSSNRSSAGEMVLGDNDKARAFVAARMRKILSEANGWDYSEISDAEVLDSILYNVWPNMSFWGGYNPINMTYRWRPNGLDPESCIMEIIQLRRVPTTGPRPSPVPVRWMAEDEKYSEVEELGVAGQIFDQDLGNMPHVQTGLRASGNGEVHFGRYSEMRIRQLHRMIDRYIAKGTQKNP